MYASDHHIEGGTFEDLRAIEDNAHEDTDILEHDVIGEGMIDYDEVL